ncbi:hypothetical protein ABPG75_004192 [Micractinium tetrahymenae]
MAPSISIHWAASNGGIAEGAEMVKTPRKCARLPTPSVSPQDSNPAAHGSGGSSGSGSGPCSPTPAPSRAAAPAAAAAEAAAAAQSPAANCFMLPRQPTKRRLFGMAPVAEQQEQAPAPQPQAALATAAEQQQTAAFLNRLEQEAHNYIVERFAERWGFDAKAGQPLPHPRFAWEQA